MYSNDKEALIRINEIANQIAISTIFNEWDLINEIQKNEIKIRCVKDAALPDTHGR